MSGLEFAVSPPTVTSARSVRDDWGSVASLGILSLRRRIERRVEGHHRREHGHSLLSPPPWLRFRARIESTPRSTCFCWRQQPAPTMCPNCAKYDLRSSCDHEGASLNVHVIARRSVAFAFTSSVSPSVFANLTSSVFRGTRTLNAQSHPPRSVLLNSRNRSHDSYSSTHLESHSTTAPLRPFQTIFEASTRHAFGIFFTHGSECLLLKLIGRTPHLRLTLRLIQRHHHRRPRTLTRGVTTVVLVAASTRDPNQRARRPPASLAPSARRALVRSHLERSTVVGRRLRSLLALSRVRTTFARATSSSSSSSRARRRSRPDVSIGDAVGRERERERRAGIVSARRRVEIDGARARCADDDDDVIPRPFAPTVDRVDRAGKRMVGASNVVVCG